MNYIDYNLLEKLATHGIDIQEICPLWIDDLERLSKTIHSLMPKNEVVLPDIPSLQQLRRYFHNCKSRCSYYGAYGLYDLLHLIEQELSRSSPNPNRITETLDELKRIIPFVIEALQSHDTTNA